MNLLPQKGNFMTMTVKHDVATKLAISQEEMKEVEMVSESGSIRWNPEKDNGKEVELTEPEHKLIADTLKSIEKSNSLDDDSFKLYQLFV